MTEPDDITRLGNEVHVLRQQLAEQRSQVYKLREQLRAYELHEGRFGSMNQISDEQLAARCHQAELTYWQGKAYRQRLAINQIQRKGWYPPDYIIYEEDPFGPLRDTA